jgi:predicted Zn-dependent peptidase
MENHLYRKTILDNGIVVHSLNIQGTSNIYYDARMRSGSIQERPGKTGVAHYLEHMFGYGSPLYKEKDVLPFFNEQGGQYNFSTGHFHTYYHAYCMKRKIPEFSKRIASVLAEPAFTPSDVELERSPILSELAQDMDHLKYNPFYHGTKKLYEGHRYATPIIGSLSDVQSLTFDDIHDYYRGNYVASNFQVVAAGNVNHDELVSSTEQNFSGLREGTPTYKANPLAFAPGNHFVPLDVQAVSVGIGFSVDPSNDERLMRFVARACLSSHLHDDIRVNGKLAYSIGCSIGTLPGEEVFSIETSVNKDKLEPVLTAIFESVKNATNASSDGYLKKVIANIEEYVADNGNRPKSVGNGLAHMIGNRDGYEAFDEYLKTAQKATPEDIQKTLKSMLAGKFFTMVVGPVDKPADGNSYVNKMRQDIGIAPAKP